MKKKEIPPSSSETSKLTRRSLFTGSIAAALCFISSKAIASPVKKQMSKTLRIAAHQRILGDEAISLLSSSLKRITDIGLEVSESSDISPLSALLNGKADMAYTSIIHEKELPPSLLFFSGVPFGMNLIETASWIKHGPGQKLFDDIFADIGLKAWILRIKGSCAGSWHHREVLDPKDYKGKKVLANGLAGNVLRRMGAETLEMPLAEAKKAFEAGRLDSIEGLNPSESINLGLERLNAVYYWPGWHTPSETFVLIMRRKTFDGLPKDIQSAFDMLTASCLSCSISSYTYENSLKTPILTNIPGLRLKKLPDSVLIETARVARGVLAATGTTDEMAKKVYGSYMDYLKKASGWTQLSDEAFSLARSLTLSYGHDIKPKS